MRECRLTGRTGAMSVLKNFDACGLAGEAVSNKTRKCGEPSMNTPLRHLKDAAIFLAVTLLIFILAGCGSSPQQPGVSRLLCKRPSFVFGDGVWGRGVVP